MGGEAHIPTRGRLCQDRGREGQQLQEINRPMTYSVSSKAFPRRQLSQGEM